MPMDETKDWWKSKTVWGAALALTGALASAFGIEIDGVADEGTVTALTAAAGAIGALIAIFGRFKARSPIA